MMLCKPSLKVIQSPQNVRIPCIIATLSGVPTQSIKRSANKKNTAYPLELRSFATTLQYYSANAYEHVCTSFNLTLPHHAQIRKWYSKIPAGQGFTQLAFDAFKAHAEKVKSENEQVLCALMLDEMEIRKHVSWNGKSFLGYFILAMMSMIDDSRWMMDEKHCSRGCCT